MRAARTCGHGRRLLADCPACAMRIPPWLYWDAIRMLAEQRRARRRSRKPAER